MKKMFKLNRWLAAGALLVGVASLQSCLDDDNGYPYDLLIPKAVVTVKPTAADAFYMQLDDETTLKPVNVTASPFGEKEVRALVNYDVVDDPASPYDQAVYINWIDSLLTKPMAPNLGEAENNAKYGDDAVDILADWVTIVEDGYLTLRFGCYGNPASTTAHFVNLVSTNNPDDPYEVEFRHNAYDDIGGQLKVGLVAFRLADLPDTEGQTVKLTLKWKSYGGDKSVTFDYCTRQTTVPGGEAIAAERSTLKMK